MRKIRRLHDVYNYTISLENLLMSWREFLKGKNKKRDVIYFSLKLMDNLIFIHDSLSNKTYNHSGYYAFKINDPKPRNIHKALVSDRVVHHAVYRILYPFFDKKFIYDSYSCRLNKGVFKGLDRFDQFVFRVSKNNSRNC